MAGTGVLTSGPSRASVEPFALDLEPYGRVVWNLTLVRGSKMTEAEYFAGVNSRLDALEASSNPYVALMAAVKAASGNQEAFTAAVEAVRLEYSRRG